MADTKISGLTELAAEPAADDELVVVDKSDTTMAASGTDKRLRYDRISGLWVPKTLVDAKGDILTATAADTPARLAVGANRRRLVADSATASGLRWDTDARDAWTPTGAIAETFPRPGTRMSDATTLVGGRLALTGGAVIPGGQTVNTITFMSIGAATAPTAQWFCLVDTAMNVLAKTADDTSTAWGANVRKTLTISGGYTPSDDMPVYLGIVCTATTTLPTLISINSGYGIWVPPMLYGTSTTGLTNPASLGGTAAAITAGAGIQPWAYCS